MYTKTRLQSTCTCTNTRDIAATIFLTGTHHQGLTNPSPIVLILTLGFNKGTNSDVRNSTTTAVIGLPWQQPLLATVQATCLRKSESNQISILGTRRWNYVYDKARFPACRIGHRRIDFRNFNDPPTSRSRVHLLLALLH